MKTLIGGIILCLVIMLALPLQAQQMDKSVRGWISCYRLTLDGANAGTDRNSLNVYYAASQADTGSKIYWETQDFCVDSVQFAVKTYDTCRYRFVLIGGCGSTTPYWGYNIASGLGLDTASTLVALLNDVPSVMSTVVGGLQWIAPVVQFAAAGNGTAGVTTHKYEVWAKVFYRWRKL